VVRKFAVAGESAVLQHQRNVVPAVWQLAVRFISVFQQIDAGEAHIKVSTSALPAVIVVPERSGSPGIVVLQAAHLPWSDSVGWKAVGAWTSHTSMQVNDAGYPEFVGVGYNRFSAAMGLDRRPRKCAVVSPDFRTKPGDDLGPCLLLAQLVIVSRGIG